MRIISGTHKGRRFLPPSTFKARPTTDLAKEALFNVLINRLDLDTLKVLDLFSGTGSISYEFASRGCESITSVEMNYSHWQFIKKTSQEFGFDQAIIPLKADVFKFIKTTGGIYDLIFADPPFDLINFETIPDLIFEKSCLAADGLLIIEHSDRISFANHPHFKELREYGKVNFSFFR